MGQKVSVFDKEESTALKGIAILLMLFHHCFRTVSLFQNYTVSFFPFSEDMIVHIAYASKICVSIFAFISGYGLFLSYKRHEETASRWVWRRYVRSFSKYWFVWALSAVICEAIDHRTRIILFEQGILQGLVNSMIDFTGLAALFKTPTLNGTWWYMSAAFVFILLIPLLYKCKNDLGLFLAGIVVFLRVITGKNGDAVFTGGNSIYVFFPALILGCLFARYRLFDCWVVRGRGHLWTKSIKLFVELFVLGLLYKAYHLLPVASFWELHFGLFPLVMILICVEYVVNIPFIGTVLRFLGRHSMNIFMVHTFIRLYYLPDFTYSFHHFALILLVLLCFSLLLSIVIEQLKKWVRYERLIQKIM